MKYLSEEGTNPPLFSADTSKDERAKQIATIALYYADTTLYFLILYGFASLTQEYNIA